MAAWLARRARSSFKIGKLADGSAGTVTAPLDIPKPFWWQPKGRVARVVLGGDWRALGQNKIHQARAR